MLDIKSYLPGNEVEILKLFKNVFKKEMTLESWKWRFEDNPAGKHMIQLMWDNNELVGHYAVSPVYVALDNTKCLSALSMTTMTHPDYVGKGIFNLLAKELYNEIAIKDGVKFVWGFPNDNSHYGFIKNLGWTDIKEIPSFTLETNKLKKVNTTNIYKVEAFSKIHENALIKSIQDFRIYVNKSVEYLTWRYIDNPSTNYEIWEAESSSDTWFMVTKIFKSFDDSNAFELDILECVVPADTSIILSFLDKIISSNANTVTKINMWLPLHDEKHILFERIGFVSSGHITYFGAKSLTGDSNLLANPNNWFYSFGDSDIY